MNRVMKAAPWLVIGVVVAFLAYSQTAVPKAVTERLNQTINAVNALPQSSPEVGQPPDSQYISERIMELPEDGNLWHTVLVLDDSPLSRHVERQFATDPRLISLTQQTKVYKYPPNDVWVQKNRAGLPRPSVLVMAPTAVGSNDYQRVYENWGSGLPADSKKLANDIAVSIRDCRPRPNPTPTPGPNPQPVTPVTPLIPVTPDEAEPVDEGGLNRLYLALAALAGGIGGAFYTARKD